MRGVVVSLDIPAQMKGVLNELAGKGSPPYQGGVRGGLERPGEQPPPRPLLGTEGVHLPNMLAACQWGSRDEWVTGDIETDEKWAHERSGPE